MASGTKNLTDVRLEERRFALVAAAFSIVAALAALDLVTDLREGTTLQHVLVEGLIVVFAAGGIAYGVNRVFTLRQREREAQDLATELESRLSESRAEARQWRSEAQDLLEGLGVMIDRQFGRWNLTRAEREVALLLLKGMSHKEVAALRSVGAATVRQQSTAIYRKAGVSGRHDLSAFFLEDLLSPRSNESSQEATSGGLQ